MAIRKTAWGKYKMKDVVLEFYDGLHATPKPAKGGPIFLGIRNLTSDGRLDFTQIRHIAEEDFAKWISRVEPHAGDLILSYEATLNLYAIIPEGFRGCLGRRLALVRPNPEIADTRFLFHYFFGEEWRKVIAINKISGATVERVPLIRFPEFEVTLPPLPTQRRIASILSAYDDLIENNTRRIKILEEMAQRLYREWFVHFRFPGHKKVKMVKGVPEGWEVKRLGEIAEEVRRSVDPTEIDPDTPYFGLEHLPRKSIALSEWGKASEVQSSKLEFKKGEILFGKIRPYFHKVGVAPMDGVCSSDTIVLTSKDPKYFSLVLASVSSEDFVNHATQTSQGTKMPRANWNVLVKYPILIAPQPFYGMFDELMQNVVAEIINLLFRNRNLRRTRDMLLPKLVSGEVEV